jgi:1L-myo-inositol 1-phosphate cytidylyltransferase / CDP-L-myo-inositol myo-inositolphosphotransferase
LSDTLDRTSTPDEARPETGVRAPRLGVILAAGRSERLATVTGGRSKAVMSVGGLSLVERAVRTLLAAGMREVVVVVGYEAETVAAAARRAAPDVVRTVRAEAWELGNGASLSAAEAAVAGEDLFVLVTADHLFGEGALDPLLAFRAPGVLVDHAPDDTAWAEGTRVRLDGERAVAFSKELEDPSIDCGAFLLSSEIFAAQRRAAAHGDASLAGAVTEMVERTGITAVALPRGAWWQDIDTPEDLRTARRLLRRSLAKAGDGPVSRYLNRPISTRLSLALAPLRPNPDLVSAVSALLALIGAVALAAGKGLAGAVSVQAASILDGCDGELARLQLRSSAAGALLDAFLDRLGDAAIVAAMATWSVSRGDDPRVVVWVAVAATAGSMLSMATKDRAALLDIPPLPERFLGWLLGGRDARLLILAIAAAAALPLLGLVVVAATSIVSVVIRVILATVAGHAVAPRGGR